MYKQKTNYMKIFIILSCYTSLEVLFAFVGGVVITIIVALVVRLREQSLMREINDLKRLSHFIQRYYWLLQKGKITEAQKKALKKTVSVFANRIMNADRSSVEIALQSFANGIFFDFKEKVKNVHFSYKNQFASVPNITSDPENSNDLFIVEIEDVITSQDAMKKIETAFEEIGVKGNYY
ncbi:hypothetical protein K9M48_01400 [Candidatus Gracilibacteria bacterium]|nr:hypothetical protein [Candidatus Gracilibacteria bacterium]